ncbi:MAG: hypothetical protein QXX68_00115 [Candidatus Pacearchaeota archaeon]
MNPKKPKQKEEKQKSDLGETIIIIFGVIFIIFNLFFMAISYSQFFFMFEDIGFSGYFLLILDFILSRGFFSLVVFALSLIYLKKIKGLFFVVAIYNLLPLIASLGEISSLKTYEIILVLILSLYFAISTIYLVYKIIRGKNEEKK